MSPVGVRGRDSSESAADVVRASLSDLSEERPDRHRQSDSSRSDFISSGKL